MQEDVKESKSYNESELIENKVVRLFKIQTGIDTLETRQALQNLNGNAHKEMRRLVASCLSIIEKAILSGKYAGFYNGEQLTDEQKRNLFKQPEDLKKALKYEIEKTWSTMCANQQKGATELGLALKSKIGENSYEDQEVSLPDSSRKAGE